MEHHPHHNHYRHAGQDQDLDQDHRHPILFQSDDLDHDLVHQLNRSHNASSNPNSHPSTRHHSISQDRKRHDGTSGYHGEDERPLHVHSQTCQDSCPVQDIYTEMSYSRFSRGARTYETRVFLWIYTDCVMAPRHPCISNQLISLSTETSMDWWSSRSLGHLQHTHHLLQFPQRICSQVTL
jgi:hypothetical protein